MVARVIEFVLVPMSLLILLFLCLGAAGRLPTPTRTGAYAGFWLGLVVVGSWVIAAEYAETGLVVKVAALCPPLLVGAFAATGAIGGVLVVGLYQRWRTRPRVAVVVFFQATVCAGGLANYFLSPPLRGAVIAFALAFTAGLCCSTFVFQALHGATESPGGRGRHPCPGAAVRRTP